MRVLIAEDDLTSRTILAAVLGKAGHEVTEVTDGSAAWEKLQEADAPRLAILDWMMPGMDGLEVIRRVRALETDRPPYLIMLTSKSGKTDIIAGLEAGADDYLAKPFDVGELRARVEVGCRLIAMQEELYRTRDALAHEASHDPLTGVLNRRAIEKALARELARESRHRQGLAVGILDIDFFKRINDTYGHGVGDETLRGLVRLLEGGLRDYDYFGRIGGEEFLVIAIAGINDAWLLFERLRMIVADNPISTRAGDIAITVSIGLRSVRDGDTIDTLFLATDTALYRAKREGRNRVCLDGGEPSMSGG